MEISLASKSWSPYFVGAAIGVLSWFAFWSADHPLGITGAFEATAALVEKAVVPDATNDCGEGRRDAIAGLLGMVAGASIFVATYSQWQPLIRSLGNRGSVTFPQLTSTSPWLWVTGLVLLGLSTLVFSLRSKTLYPHLSKVKNGINS